MPGARRSGCARTSGLGARTSGLGALVGSGETDRLTILTGIGWLGVVTILVILLALLGKIGKGALASARVVGATDEEGKTTTLLIGLKGLIQLVGLTVP